ncbi:hypothetical protein [Rhizocola hellebori]|nr:hypothetical protein [Rhizocola hellebori]
MNHPMTLRDLIATNIRRLRSGTSVQHEDVARAATHFGLEWTAAWVSAVERGQKALTAEQLIALPLVLTTALQHRVSLSDLLLGEGSLHLGKPIPGTTLSTYYLREIITASPFRRSFLDFDKAELEAQMLAAEQSAAAAAAEKMREITRANLGDVDIRALKRAEEGATAHESKLAKKLEVPEIVVIAAAASLWGRSLTEERDALLQPDEGIPAPKPAVIMRKLTNLIQDKLEEAAAQAQAAEAEKPLRELANSNSMTAAYPVIASANTPGRVEPEDEFDSEFGDDFDDELAIESPSTDFLDDETETENADDAVSSLTTR